MNNEIKTHIVNPIDRLGIDVVLYSDSMGCRSVGTYDTELDAFVYEEHQPGSLINRKCYLRLSQDEARAIYDGLGNIFEPAEASATTQKLEVTEKHLIDTKLLLAAILPSALREEEVRMNPTIALSDTKVTINKKKDE